MQNILESLKNRDEHFILERMLDNLAFFRVHNKKIADSIANMIEGKNKKYRLLFSKDDINIIDLQNKIFLYPKDSILDISSNLALNPLNNSQWRVYSNDIKLAKIEIKNLKITAESINKMVDFTYLNIIDSNTSFHLPSLFLPQTNIFGLMGGIFLQILLESGYRFHSLLIFEEDIELFSIACYFVDFRALFDLVNDKSCYIFIENIKTKSFLSHYFYNKRVTNNLLRLELSAFISPKITKIKEMVLESYKANARGWGSFEDEMIGVKNTIKNIKQSKMLDSPKKLNIPICVVGSGPSLESNISFLRTNCNNMIIFSCGTALKVLRAHNIKVDFQIEIERIDYLADVLYDAPLGDTPLICASVVDNKVINLAKESYIFNRGGSASSYMIKDLKALEFCSPFVGNAGFVLACKFSDEIILCGIDCGFIKGKSKHSSGSFYGAESSTLPSDTFKVRGNFDDEVYSNSIFSLSKEILELAIAHYKPHKVYNINNGAYISGACPIKHIELKNISNKNIAIESIKDSFTHNAEIKDNLRGDIKDYINNLKSKILDSKVTTKQELFCFIDDISKFLFQESSKNGEIGILFEGSMLHLLQNLLLCLLYEKTNDISSSYKDLSNIIAECLESFLIESKSLFI